MGAENRVPPAVGEERPGSAAVRGWALLVVVVMLKALNMQPSYIGERIPCLF